MCDGASENVLAAERHGQRSGNHQSRLAGPLLGREPIEVAGRQDTAERVGNRDIGPHKGSGADHAGERLLLALLRPIPGKTLGIYLKPLARRRLLPRVLTIVSSLPLGRPVPKAEW